MSRHRNGDTAGAPSGAGPDADSPSPPQAPDVINRNPLAAPLSARCTWTPPSASTGRLDEPIYATTPAMSDFFLQEPREGLPATEENRSVAVLRREQRLRHLQVLGDQPDLLVANEMRRDNNNIFQNDHVAIMFDTLNDRNGIELASRRSAALGRTADQRADVQLDWNPVWDVAVGRFRHGLDRRDGHPLQVAALPGRTEQAWRFNARAPTVEERDVVPHPHSGLPVLRGTVDQFACGRRVDLRVAVGLAQPRRQALRLSGLSSDCAPYRTCATDLSGEIVSTRGMAITQNIAADFTYNTDFAQVEADEQQVNLTRFSLFFPEKREFFLENAGLFSFGGVGLTNTPGDTPILFYSRRIGLNGGLAVPITAGGRLTGRVGRTSFGLLNVESADDATSGAVDTNFTVARVPPGHPAPQQHRRAGNEPFAAAERNRQQSGVRRGRDLCLLHQPHRRGVLGPDR
jgi:hypothetical protein